MREYTGQDGRPRSSLDVRASEMRMLDRRSAQEQPGTAGAAEPSLSDDVPF